MFLKARLNSFPNYLTAPACQHWPDSITGRKALLTRKHCVGLPALRVTSIEAYQHWGLPALDDTTTAYQSTYSSNDEVYSGAMRILVSNDDGIHSPALHALAEMASQHGEVVVAAPAAEQSATSHSISAYVPLRAKKSRVVRTSQGVTPAYSISGTPADAVAVGLHMFDTIDLVLSGINLGVNAGFSVMHSGTVAAARQAAAMGVPGIAFSCVDNSLEQDFLRFAPYVSHAVQARAQHNIALLNVNFPAAGRPDPFHAGDVVPAPVEPKGVYWTHMATKQYERRIIEATEPRGRTVYWLTYVGMPDPEEGSDRWALANNYVSLTPLTLQGADLAVLEHLPQAPAEVAENVVAENVAAEAENN